ncbi:hypothetical protein BH11BAC6_BH11BAC6_16240 [soil metagenome]
MPNDNSSPKEGDNKTEHIKIQQQPAAEKDTAVQSQPAEQQQQ